MNELYRSSIVAGLNNIRNSRNMRVEADYHTTSPSVLCFHGGGGASANNHNLDDAGAVVDLVAVDNLVFHDLDFAMKNKSVSKSNSNSKALVDLDNAETDMFSYLQHERIVQLSVPVTEMSEIESLEMDTMGNLAEALQLRCKCSSGGSRSSSRSTSNDNDCCCVHSVEGEEDEDDGKEDDDCDKQWFTNLADSDDRGGGGTTAMAMGNEDDDVSFYYFNLFIIIIIHFLLLLLLLATEA